VRLVDPARPSSSWHSPPPARAGSSATGAAGVRTRAGRRLDSPALVADGTHARADAYVSLAFVASGAVVALGLDIAEPLIGRAITLVLCASPVSRRRPSAPGTPTITGAADEHTHKRLGQSTG